MDRTKVLREDAHWGSSDNEEFSSETVARVPRLAKFSFDDFNKLEIAGQDRG